MIQTTDTSEKGLEALIVESLVSCADYVQGSSEDCNFVQVFNNGHWTAIQNVPVEEV